MSKEIKDVLLNLYAEAKRNIDKTVDKEFYRLVLKSKVANKHVYVINVKPFRIIKTTIKQAVSAEYFLNDIFKTFDEAKEHLLKALNKERKDILDKLEKADEAIKLIKEIKE